MVPARALRRALAMLACAGLLMACQREAAAPVVDAVSLAAYEREQAEWRALRLEELTKADGWSSLIGLHWLDPGTHRVGSDLDNGIRLTMGPEHLGLFTVHAGRVEFVADVPVTIDGAPARRGALRTDQDPAGATLVAFDEGRGLASVIERGGRMALRVKHADADSRLRFSGLQYWPGGPEWRVQARFVAHPAGRTLPIANIIGSIDEVPNPGALEFERDGRVHRLEALEDGAGGLFLVFADRTSGHGSYGAGRYIDAAAPDPRGRVLIDFNRAYNPPCALTPFATCPLPPPENRLDLAVEAGERDYAKPGPHTQEDRP